MPCVYVCPACLCVCHVCVYVLRARVCACVCCGFGDGDDGQVLDMELQGGPDRFKPRHDVFPGWRGSHPLSEGVHCSVCVSPRPSVVACFDTLRIAKDSAVSACACMRALSGMGRRCGVVQALLAMDAHTTYVRCSPRHTGNIIIIFDPVK